MNASSQKSPDFKKVNPVLLLGAGYLVPAGGFFLMGRKYRNRAILLTIVVHLVFLLGMCLQGGLVWPIWSMKDPGFSIINIPSFVISMGAGWPALLSLWAHLPVEAFSSPDWMNTYTDPRWPALAIKEAQPFAELGSFYCLVAGALNYFIVWQTLDRREGQLSQPTEAAESAGE